MKRIVGISGGTLETTDSLNKYALKLTGKERPHVLFVPTASEDAQGYINNIVRYYENLRCEVDTLFLCGISDSHQVIQEKLSWADLIYVGGGDTETMLDIWNKQGVDQLIMEACEAGKVLTGISAGMIFWFAYGHSDSEYFKNPEDWNYKFVKGLNVYPMVICPHYNEEGRDSFDEMLNESNVGIDGLALENETAVLIEGERLQILKAEEERNVYYFEWNGEKYFKRSLKNGEELHFY